MHSKDVSKPNAKISDGTKWNGQARARKKALAAQFADDLDAIASAFASHENSETIVVRHVEHAFSSLSRLGLMRKRFLLRTDFWSSIGGLLVGISLAIPDWIGLLPENAKNVLTSNNIPFVMGS